MRIHSLSTSSQHIRGAAIRHFFITAIVCICAPNHCYAAIVSAINASLAGRLNSSPIDPQTFKPGEITAGHIPYAGGLLVDEGIQIFNLERVSPLPGMTASLILPDTGGYTLGPSTTSIQANGATIETITREWRSPTTQLDVTETVIANKNGILEMRYKGIGVPGQDSFGFGGTIEFHDDPKEILKYGTKASVSAGDPGKIVIDIIPVTSTGTRVPIDYLAQQLGYDHLNWVQYVTGFPNSWTHEEIWLDVAIDSVRDNSDPPEIKSKLHAQYDAAQGFFRHGADGSGPPVIAYPATTPMLDPYPVEISGRQGTFFYVGANGVLVHWDIAPSFTNLDRDTLPFYYGGFNLSSNVVRPDIYKFHFEDRPTQPLGTMLPDEYISFSTRLVGVKEDGEYDFLGVDVTWKSNGMGTTGGVFIDQPAGATISGLFDGILTSGGVFDVAVTFSDPNDVAAVPEPSAFLIWSSFTLLGLAARCRVAVGDRVRILRGTLAGLAGKVFQLLGDDKCVLAIDGIEPGVSLVVNHDALTVEAPPSHAS